MKPFLVDVPVRINIWTRPECQKRQLEVLQKARPSVLFIQSDGGRNEDEWNAINQNRKLVDEGLDWSCKVYRFYEDQNNGLYKMDQKVIDFIWTKVDRCIFLEDDHIPAVSFFQFCAELLEKYENDERIEMICGNNLLGINDNVTNADYFFTERGWSIWGTATWRRNSLQNRGFPLPYREDEYVKRCLRMNMNRYWKARAIGYCSGLFVDGHRPGSEYQHAANSVLYHRISIVPTRNMISNIGSIGEHVKGSKRTSKFFNQKSYEISFPIRHPNYVVDDKEFGEKYLKYLKLDDASCFVRVFRNTRRLLYRIINGTVFQFLKKQRIETEK